MSHYCHLLHSQSQLADPNNLALLADASGVICGPEFNFSAARDAAPNARLYASFNAAKLYMGGENNAFWIATRQRLLTRKRVKTSLVQMDGRWIRVADEGSSAFVYSREDWGGIPQDPGDPTPHVLIEPTLENAEDYADVINWRVGELSESCGAPVYPYIDDAPRLRPQRLIRQNLPMDADRWTAYLTHLLQRIVPSPLVNCAGKVPWCHCGVSCEYPATSISQMIQIAAADRESLLVYWGYETVGDLWTGGVYLS